MHKLKNKAIINVDINRVIKTIYFILLILVLLTLIFFIFIDVALQTNFSASKVITFSFLPLIILHFFSILRANVKIDDAYLYISAGLFVHKRILFKDINSISIIDYDKVSISRDNPVFSKNVVVIEYKQNKKIYISIKEKEEFMNILKKLIDI